MNESKKILIVDTPATGAQRPPRDAKPDITINTLDASGYPAGVHFD